MGVRMGKGRRRAARKRRKEGRSVRVHRGWRKPLGQIGGWTRERPAFNLGSGGGGRSSRKGEVCGVGVGWGGGGLEANDITAGQRKRGEQPAPEK